MDYIHIEKLRLLGKHGVGAQERKVEQEFELSVCLAVGDTKIAAQSEKLKDAVDYQPIKGAIAAIVEHNSYYLIETRAEKIVQKILEDKRIVSAELTIKKKAVWDNGIPGLTIVRKNK